MKVGSGMCMFMQNLDNGSCLAQIFMGFMLSAIADA